jgi:hypothetical protein
LTSEPTRLHHLCLTKSTRNSSGETVLICPNRTHCNMVLLVPAIFIPGEWCIWPPARRAREEHSELAKQLRRLRKIVADGNASRRNARTLRTVCRTRGLTVGRHKGFCFWRRCIAAWARREPPGCRSCAGGFCDCLFSRRILERLCERVPAQGPTQTRGC